MEAKIYGYVRVSTREQNEARQMIAMAEFGIRADCIYVDKQSGKDFDRPKYKQLMRRLKRGDTLVIKSIDRLGRCYQDIIEQWRIITREKGADIVVLDMALLDTRQGKDLVGTLISDIVLQLLSYVAQTEREYIKSRQAEGIAAAKARGVRFGPRPKERPQEFLQYVSAWKSGDISAREAARHMHICHKTFLRWARNVTENAHCIM